MSEQDDLNRLLEANVRFYDAFERRSVDAMGEVWEQSDRVFCVHPGWPIYRGWLTVAASWFRLFSNSERLQFVLSNVQGQLIGDIGWVTCEENILDGTTTGRTFAVNLLVRSGVDWKVIGHIASSSYR